MAEEEDFNISDDKIHVKPRHTVPSMEYSYASGNQSPYSSSPANFWREHQPLSQSSSIESYQNEVFDTENSEHNRRPRLESQSSIVDGLLFEIYDRWHDTRLDSFDSDTFTECSSTSEFMHGRRSSYIRGVTLGGLQLNNLHKGLLEEQTSNQLLNLVTEMKRAISQTSTKLVKQLKRRERRLAKLMTNCDIITAIIQASSPKRRIDTKMRFTVEPPPGESAFDQWKDAMKAVARLPLGIPDEFRKKVWLYLADNYIKEIKIDWEKTVKFVFNERSNPDDNKLGLQIVKDLHRTGCSGFSGEDNVEERASLKRILLAYARWNKVVGYCQGFNIIAAVLLDVLDRREDDALKVMIYLIDSVLPHSYFANNLRALSVDMAVFRDLLKIFPKLSKHLDYLQHAQDQASGGCYEPPLTNVFTMQWFLTLFATCLPKATVLRVWDSIMLEGSEILLRTALTIWGRLSSRLLTVNSADEFYTLMGDLTQEMLQGNMLDADSMIKHIYTLAPFPFPQLNELREKYTYNIRPFTRPTGANKKSSWIDGGVLPSDEDDLDDEDIEAITCFTGFIPTATSGMRNKALDGDQRAVSVPDFSSLGPGAYGQGQGDSLGMAGVPAYMERMSTDIGALKKQYAKLKQRQMQAHIILSSNSAKQQYAAKSKPIVPKMELPTAVNHLFLAKKGTHGKNRYVAAGPRIANMYPVTRPVALEDSPRKVRPITPHIIGDTKCKWVQKQKKEPDRNLKSPVSPKKTSAMNDIQELEAKPDKNLSEDENVKKVKEKNNNNSKVSNIGILDSEGIMNDSGLGTSIHSSESTDHVGANVSEVSQGSSEGKVDIVEDNDESVLEKQGSEKIKDVQEPRAANDLNHGIHDESGTTHESEHLRSELLGNQGNDVDSSSENEAFSHEISGSKEKFIFPDTEYTDKDPSTSGAVLGLNHPGHGTGALKENKTNSLSHELENGDVNRAHVDNSPQSYEEFEADIIAMNINNNCVSVAEDETVKPKVALSNQSLANRNTVTDKVQNSSKSQKMNSVKEFRGRAISQPTEADPESVNMYYSNKKNLAAKSSSFDDHLQTYWQAKKTFNPFPVKHVNTNRAKTGLKLGLYKQSTLDEFEKNLRKPVWGK